MHEVNKMLCPIGFGDCPDCIYYRGGRCQYEDDKLSM